MVGVLGDMGPSATADFYAKLIRHTPATRDQEHLPVVIWADPRVPSRQKALLEAGADPTPWLEDGVRHLVAAGAQIVVVPCNTVHVFLEPVMRDQPVEFISIIDATVAAIQRGGHRTVGLLATDGALVSNLFQSAFAASGLEWLLPPPDEQQQLMRLVEAVKAGPVEPAIRAGAERIITRLAEQGCSSIVAGCTEISTLIGDTTVAGIDLIDPAVELALCTIERASVGQPT